MEPKTRKEREVTEYSQELPSVNKAVEWAKKNLFAKVAYRSAGWLWCTECGGLWMGSEEELVCNNGSIECPYCHQKIKVVNSKKRRSCDEVMMTIATVSHGYQVFRHIYCKRLSAMGIQGASHEFHEIIQEWIDNTGKRTVIARNRGFMGYGWNYHKPMSIKHANSIYDYSTGGEIYPRPRLTEELKKRGLNKAILNKAIPSSISTDLLRGGNDTELCIKTKQYDMLRFMHIRCMMHIPNKPSFNICNRNHYIIKDASMWVDYIEALDYLNKDIHNAHYVCPKNLKKEHDRYMKLKEREEKKKKLEEEKKRIQNEEYDYIKNKGKFIGITFSGNDIDVHVLCSVREFFEEGAAMHHCVFEMGYYKKPESLILSARDKAGNRLETIEVNLKTFKIIQSRAICNGVTDRHNDIINLVEKNINLIKGVA